MLQKLLIVASLLTLQSCASYQYAHQIKMVSFDKNFTQGISVGPIEGKDCTWSIFGHQFGAGPSVEEAFINVRSRGEGQQLRYINNLNSNMDGFDAGVVAKECITLTGVGYL